MEAFAVDSGVWAVSSGRLEVSAGSIGYDAASVFHVGEMLPTYYEILATISAGKPNSGWKSNAYVIFDYQSPIDFKFAGVNISLNKIQMGHRTSAGWIVDVQVPCQVKPDRLYNLLVAVNGTTVTLVVDGSQVFSYAFEPRVIEGYSFGLNTGMVGVGSDNSRGTFDNIQVQVLPPQFTFQNTEDFSDGVADLFDPALSGAWTVAGSRYYGGGSDLALSLLDLGLENGLNTGSVLELAATASGSGLTGLVFDLYSPEDFKFVALDAAGSRILIGHHTSRKGWVIDQQNAVSTLAPGDHTLTLSLKGTTVSVSLDGQMTKGYVYNAVVVDGQFGLFESGGSASFDTVTVRIDDPAFLPAGQALVASKAPEVSEHTVSGLSLEALAPIVKEAKERWSASGLLEASALAALNVVSFQIAELDGLSLGYTKGTTLRLHADAAGWGWFVDGTPARDEEYVSRGARPQLTAKPGSAARGCMDLLTVVMHELGHAAGLQDLNPNPEALMSSSLEVGARRLPKGEAGRPQSLPALSRFSGAASASWIRSFLKGLEAEEDLI
jgi:hypothetical protein